MQDFERRRKFVPLNERDDYEKPEQKEEKDVKREYQIGQVVRVGRKKDPKTGEYAFVEEGWRVMGLLQSDIGTQVLVRRHSDDGKGFLEKRFKPEELDKWNS